MQRQGWIIYPLCSVVLFLPVKVQAQLSVQASEYQPSQSLVSWIEKNRRTQQYTFPGVSVAVIKNYQIKWVQGFGFSNQKQQLPVKPNTLFQAASISKPITAVAAMIAFKQHNLSIDEPINQVFKTFVANPQVGSWQLPNPFSPNNPVTLRLLLCHIAGTNDFRYSGYRYGYYRTPPTAIESIPTLAQELNGLPPANRPAIAVIRKPGVYWVYSPAGYTVVQAALMDIEGGDFAAIMKKLILVPLGMDNSTFIQPLPQALIPQIAVPYLPNGQPLRDGPRVFNTASSGGLTTTPGDLAKFVIAFQKALNGQFQGYITPQIARRMMQRQPGKIDLGHCFPTSNPPQKACQSSWGLGFDVNLNKYLEHQPDGTPTGNYFAHTGFNSGYLSVMLGSKKGGNGVVIMTNMAPEDMSGEVPQFQFLSKLVRRIADEEGWK